MTVNPRKFHGGTSQQLRASHGGSQPPSLSCGVSGARSRSEWMASVMKATDPQFARALRRALRDHKHVEVALREAIVATLRASGRVVTGATIGRRFSELRGVVAPDELFDFNDEDDCFVLYNALDQS